MIDFNFSWIKLRFRSLCYYDLNKDVYVVLLELDEGTKTMICLQVELQIYVIEICAENNPGQRASR